MALTDILRERAARKGGTAQVDCGELGLLTVEALSPADCARLSDSRALLYAACRELQRAGEELRSEGKIFRPDEILTYVTDTEADVAARTILELSGVTGSLSEIRHQSVQAPAEVFSEIRHQSVQTPEGRVSKNGQVSREFSAETDVSAVAMDADKKAQILEQLSSRTAQSLVSETGKDHQMISLGEKVSVGLHEIESELQRQAKGKLHETKSELRSSGLQKLHETTSDFGRRRGMELHETESEYGWMMHEIKSELQKGLHEIKSEVRQMLHEIESELPKQAAQRLAEALLKAGQVR